MLQTLSVSPVPILLFHLHSWVSNLSVYDAISSRVQVPECPADGKQGQAKTHCHKQRDEKDGREEVGATFSHHGHVQGVVERAVDSHSTLKRDKMADMRYECRKRLAM